MFSKLAGHMKLAELAKLLKDGIRIQINLEKLEI